MFMVFKQDSHCTKNVTLWCVHITIVAMETQQCIHFVLLTYL